MSFSVVQKLPGNYFQDVMDAQAEIVNMYPDDLENPLVFSHYCGNTMVTFRFYSYSVMMLRPVTLHVSNLGDLKDQFFINIR